MIIAKSIDEAIGRTPLIRLNGPSHATGCAILGKAEFMNPGGSVKDRTALGILDAAAESGALKPGGTVVEGTAGNTGIALALLCRARGYHAIIVMPDNQSPEKYDAIRAIGATLQIVPAVPYANDNHYQKVAARVAQTTPNAIWANQFDNTANRDVHYRTTGAEIWTDTNGKIDAFVASSGTGGTLGGVSRYLRERSSKVRIVLADPQGSALYNFVTRGVLAAEGPGSVTEGIGIGRVTANFEGSPIDTAVHVTDTMAVSAVHHLLRDEGLFVGSASGVNVCGALQVARQRGPGHIIVTILCDGGQKYQSRLFNRDWLASKNLAEAAETAAW
jgi:cysteine synthase A